MPENFPSFFLDVFPAGAGVILPSWKALAKKKGVSRRRGGDPANSDFTCSNFACFPQARG